MKGRTCLRMLDPEILRKVKNIQIKTDRLINEVLAGNYASAFKGVGMEFEEIREYFPGDDIRDIDWNVTARTGRPHIKKFVEERELTVMLLVDLSGSQQFGTTGALKAELAAEAAALLAFLAIANNDRVGLVIFSDRIEKFIPPQKGRRHVLRLVREILTYRPEGRGTKIQSALDFLNKVTIHGSVAFLVSDFIDEGYARQLRISARRHDLVAVTIHDRREHELPSVGLLRLMDAESGNEITVDTADAAVRERFSRLAEERCARRDHLLLTSGVEALHLTTGEPYLNAFRKFFAARERRQGA